MSDQPTHGLPGLRVTAAAAALAVAGRRSPAPRAWLRMRPRQRPAARQRGRRTAGQAHDRARARGLGRRSAGTPSPRILQHAATPSTLRPTRCGGPADDTAYLHDFLHTISGPIVLVGHSYGGVVTTNAATGDRHVKALVYDDAYVPAQGETLVDLTSAGSCFAVPDLSTVFNFVPYPGTPPAAPTPTSSRTCSRLLRQRPARRRGCSAGRHPAAPSHQRAHDQSGVPAWKTIPSWDVVGTADQSSRRPSSCSWPSSAHARITEIHAPTSR